MSDPQTTKEEIITAIRERRDELDVLLGKGKGTFCQPDYVKDDTWSRWIGARSELEELMRRFA